MNEHDKLVYCSCNLKAHKHGRWVSLRTYLIHQAASRSSSFLDNPIPNQIQEPRLPPQVPLDDISNEAEEVEFTVGIPPIHDDLYVTERINTEGNNCSQHREIGHDDEVEFQGFVFDLDEEELDSDTDIDEMDDGYEVEENNDENDEDSEVNIQSHLDEDDPDSLRFLLWQLKELSSITFFKSHKLIVFLVMNRSPIYGESLDYLNWKFKYNTSDNSYVDLLKHLSTSGLHLKSHRETHHYLSKLFGIQRTKYDCCVNNCMAFTGPDKLRRRCILCGEARFHKVEGEEEINDEFYMDSQELVGLRARSVYFYLPLIPRLRLLYANGDYSEKMRYPASLELEPWEEGVRDVWDGQIMKSLSGEGLCPYLYLWLILL
jgi:hypothetical protein